MGRGNRDIADVLVSKCWGAGNPDYEKAVTNIIAWDQVMAQKTYRIELKVNFKDNSNHEIMLGIAKQYARDLLASSMLLQDGSSPQVALTDDSFHGREDIDLLAASEELHQ